MRNIKYILANCRFGQKKYGVEYGPEKILKTIHTNNLNLNHKREIIQSHEFNDFYGYHKLFKSVKKNLENNNFPIVLGGDHSIGLSTLSASFDVFKEDLTVIWMDAHADINTFETSTTGNLHGMPLASVFNIMDPIIHQNYIPKFNQLIYLGLRDVDEPERKILDKYDILCFDMKTIRENGLEKTWEIVKKKSNKNIHLSFDVDVLDPKIASATGTPVANGMLLKEAMYFLNKIKKEKTIKTFDFVEYNPFIPDINANTIKNSVKIVNKIIN